MVLSSIHLPPHQSQVCVHAHACVHSHMPSSMSAEVSATRASPADGLDSLIEESSDAEMAEATPPAADSSSPMYKRKHRNRYRMSSVIKLEYDLSNPVYEKFKNLVVLYLLRWFLPNAKEQLGGVAAREGVYFLPPPVHHDSMAVSGMGAELMKQMWFTSRDNISLLLEICRQGFSILTDPTHMRLLVDLYRHWNQVRVLRRKEGRGNGRC